VRGAKAIGSAWKRTSFCVKKVIIGNILVLAKGAERGMRASLVNVEEDMKITMKNELFKLGVLTAIVAVAMPEISLAQQDLNQWTEAVATEEGTAIPYVVTVIGYIIGAVLMLSGALSLKKHAENPATEPLGKGLGRLIIGAIITAIPALLSMLQESSKLGDEEADFRGFDSLSF